MLLSKTHLSLQTELDFLSLSTEQIQLWISNTNSCTRFSSLETNGRHRVTCRTKQRPVLIAKGEPKFRLVPLHDNKGWQGLQSVRRHQLKDMCRHRIEFCLICRLGLCTVLLVLHLRLNVQVSRAALRGQPGDLNNLIVPSRCCLCCPRTLP